MGKKIPSENVFQELEWFTSLGYSIYDVINVYGMRLDTVKRQAYRHERWDILELIARFEDEW